MEPEDSTGACVRKVLSSVSGCVSGSSLEQQTQCHWLNVALSHLPLDKMAAISQTVFSDVFSSIKSFVF